MSDGHVAFHFYDADAAGDFRLAIIELGRDAQGWPVAEAPAG